jgi:hypothetical protein
MRRAPHVFRVPVFTRRRGLAVCALICADIVVASSRAPVSAAQCHRDGGFDATEIAQSTFFSTRGQTKFAPSERHYPLATAASARYCFSRGCTGQLTVAWTADEQEQLRNLRRALVTTEMAQAELYFIKVAILRMEMWLYTRLRSLDARTVAEITRKVSKHVGEHRSETETWVASALSTYDRFDKECATYAMEATQHLLVLANLGLLRHWNVTAPVYRYGIPGHWTAGLENRETCERYRFDLNSRASRRHDLHVRGQDPAALASSGERTALFPGMDHAGMGQPTGRPDRPAGGYALQGPRAPDVPPARTR